jgi:hypothetical protein
MRDKEKRYSAVTVKAIDFSDLQETARLALQEKNPDRTVTGASVGTWAYAETATGLMALNDEGVGDQEPLSDEYPLEVHVYGEYEKDGQKSMDIMPVIGYRFTDPDEIRKLPHTVTPLKDFIRTFGHRLESNFRIWEKTLTEQGVEV